MKKQTPLWLLFSLLSGILASLPLVIDAIPYLSFLLFVPYFAFLYTRQKGTRLGFYYLSGLLFYLGYHMGAFSFFAAMYPLEFTGIGPLGSIAVLFAAMLLLPLFQALFAAISILLLGCLRKWGLLRIPLFFSLALASLYTLFAFAQNFTWAGVPWASTAVGIASSPLIVQGASLLGTTFLTFFIVFVNAALAEGLIHLCAARSKAALVALSVAFLLFSSQLLLGAARLSRVNDAKGTITVALIQGAYPADTIDFDPYDHVAVCEEEALAAAKEAEERGIALDLMLWAESVCPDAIQWDPVMQVWFSEIAEKTGVTQVIGTFSSEEAKDGELGYYNALYVFHPGGTVGEENYKKRRPVPFGEYLPMASLFETVLPVLTEISMLSRDTTAGKEPTLLPIGENGLGALICFDSIYPALARASVKNGASLLLLSTDDSWFDGSFGKSLHYRHAVLRAVENGRTVVRTANTGQSGVIDPYGRTVFAIPADTPAYGIASADLSTHTTLYTLIGDVFPPLCLAFLFSTPLFCLLRRKKHVTKGSYDGSRNSHSPRRP